MKDVRSFLIIKAVACAFFFAFIQSSPAQSTPSKARVDNVTDEYFGVRITDPYRWMEDLKAKETQDWMKAQANYTDAYLKKLPLRDALLKRIEEVSNAGTVVGGIQRRGDRYFYGKLTPGEQDRKVYVRDGLSGAERLLVDPNTYSKDGKRYSITNYSPSPDGKLLAFLISPGGSEFGETRVLDVATGRETGDLLPNTRWNAASWLPDNRSFFYLKFQTLAADAPPTEVYKKSRVFRHFLGTKIEDDKPVFGFGVNSAIALAPEPLPSVFVPLGSKYAFASVNSGVSPNSEYWFAPVGALEQNPIPWRKIFSLSDEVAFFAINGDDIYALTYKNTPRYKIIRLNLKNFDLAKAETAFPASEAIVENVSAARDALYVGTLDGGVRKIYRVDYKTLKAEPIRLPYEGSASGGGQLDRDGIFFGLNSWTRAFAYFSYDPKTQTATDTKLVPPIPVDMSGIEAVDVKVKSHDGVMIPAVILQKKGLKRDGKNPTLMNGYGAYGVENISPFFATFLLPWLERGGVFVWTGIRGGGEYGEEWHQAGFQKTKPNTWKDFIAIAEYLIKEKYTSSRYLGIEGGSAGGILISNAIAERPDLFGAAIIQVGLNNALRAELTANGVPNIPEFGTFKTEEGFRALLAMDGYLKIKDGVKYPAVLLTHGINDPRVEPWMSAKMAARLQAASASGKPVLLRLDYDAGHGIGSTRKQANEEQADFFAFLFYQLSEGK